MRKIEYSEMVAIEAGKLCLGKLTGTEGYWGIVNLDANDDLRPNKTNIFICREYGNLYIVLYVPNLISYRKYYYDLNNLFGMFDPSYGYYIGGELIFGKA